MNEKISTVNGKLKNDIPNNPVVESMTLEAARTTKTTTAKSEFVLDLGRGTLAVAVAAAPSRRRSR